MTIAVPPSGAAELSVAGRCTIAGKELPCSATIADVRIVEIACSHLVAMDDIGTEVIAYLDGIGMIAGTVQASTPTGFTVAVSVSDERRTRIERRLAWLHTHESDTPDRRAAPRIVPRNRSTMLRWPDGSLKAAEILDLSMSGAGLAVAERPEVGWTVTVGKRNARVVRHTDDGIGVAFALPFSSQTFDEHVVP